MRSTVAHGLNRYQGKFTEAPGPQKRPFDPPYPDSRVESTFYRPVESWCRFRSGGGLRLLPDGFDSVDELYADDQLGQLVVSVEAAPTVLCRLGEFEDHGERRLVGEASLGSHGTAGLTRTGFSTTADAPCPCGQSDRVSAQGFRRNDWHCGSTSPAALVRRRAICSAGKEPQLQLRSCFSIRLPRGAQ